MSKSFTRTSSQTSSFRRAPSYQDTKEPISENYSKLIEKKQLEKIQKGYSDFYIGAEKNNQTFSKQEKQPVTPPNEDISRSKYFFFVANLTE